MRLSADESRRTLAALDLKTSLSPSPPSPVQLQASASISPRALTCRLAVKHALDVYEVEMVSCVVSRRLITNSEARLKKKSC